MNSNMEEEIAMLTTYSELAALIGSYHSSIHLSNAEKASELVNKITGLVNEKLMTLRAHIPAHIQI